MAGERRYMSFLNVSAAGPGGLPKDVQLDFYPKAMAQLENTHADALYYSQFWQEPGGWPGAVRFKNQDLVGAQFADVERGFLESGRWFQAMAMEEPLGPFDGGGIHFIFSGHGREDGTLVLENETSFSPKDLIDLALEARGSAGCDEQTKLVVYLDSCHSGAFILELVERVELDYGTSLGVFQALASCLPDELSYEIPALGHGLATYCHSLRTQHLFDLMALGGRFSIPTWAVLRGAGGCSLATMGKQNPFVIDRWHGVSVCNRKLRSVNEGWSSGSRAVIERELIRARSEFQAGVEAIYDTFVDTSNGVDMSDHIETLMSIGGISLSRSILSNEEESPENINGSTS